MIQWICVLFVHIIITIQCHALDFCRKKALCHLQKFRLCIGNFRFFGKCFPHLRSIFSLSIRHIAQTQPNIKVFKTIANDCTYILNKLIRNNRLQIYEYLDSPVISSRVMTGWNFLRHLSKDFSIFPLWMLNMYFSLCQGNHI